MNLFIILNEASECAVIFNTILQWSLLTDTSEIQESLSVAGRIQLV